MKIKIFQIDRNKDTKHLFLACYEKTKGVVDPSIYRQVFMGDVNILDGSEDYVFEVILNMFSCDFPSTFCCKEAHSITLSDVVVTETGAFYCDDHFEFKRIDFDVSKVDTSDLIKVIVVEPRRDPYISMISNSLDTFQHVVGGPIEVVGSEPSIKIICDEKGKLKGYGACKGLALSDGSIYDYLYGTLIVIGVEGENFRSLTDEELSLYLEKMSLPSVII